MLEKISGVANLGISSTLPGFVGSNWGPEVDGIHRRFDEICCDAGFVDLIGFEIVLGRNFDKNSLSEINKAYIVNEYFVKSFHLGNPLGKTILNGFKVISENPADVLSSD